MKFFRWPMEIWLRIGIWGIFAFFVPGCILLLYAFAIEPFSPEINQHEVVLKKWHAEHNGLKVLLIGDPHLHATVRELAMWHEIVAQANALKPDLVLLLGDYMAWRYDRQPGESPENIAALLGKIKGRYGTFAVMGNHDFGALGQRLKRAFHAEGVTVLERRAVEVEIAGKTIRLLGIPYISKSHQGWGWAFPEEEDPVIVLSHSPVAFELSMPYELMVAAHTHGGQVQLPWGRWHLAPPKYRMRNYAGWREEGERKLFVTRGVGTTVLRARLFAPPEIVLLTISGSGNQRR